MSTAETIQANSHAIIAYTLRNAAGDLLDGTSLEGGEPIEYVHGYGMLVPGLESELVGLRAGDSKTIVVSAEEGFGERDEELVLELPRSEFPDPTKVEVGDEFIAESPDGDEMPMRVTAVQGDVVRVDANHPLAGVELHYSVEIQAVRQATAEEIAQAVSDAEEALAGGHACCDHDHDHDHEHDHGHAGHDHGGHTHHHGPAGAGGGKGKGTSK